MKKWNVVACLVLAAGLAVLPMGSQEKKKEAPKPAVSPSQAVLEQWNELRPEANRSDLYRRLSKLKQDSEILLVGHEPYLGTMIGEMVSGNGNSHISLKKGGLAKIRVTSFVPKASGELRWLLTPKQIRKLS